MAKKKRVKRKYHPKKSQPQQKPIGGLKHQLEIINTLKPYMAAGKEKMEDKAHEVNN
jgi:hypothetical protein